jgi:hypothetical protein
VSTRELSVVYRGVPIGLLRLPSLADLAQIDREGAEVLSGGEADVDHGGRNVIRQEFVPLPGYASARSQFLQDTGLVDPLTGGYNASKAACAELELRDGMGKQVEGQVVRFWEFRAGPAVQYGINVIFYAAGAGVVGAWGPIAPEAQIVNHPRPNFGLKLSAGPRHGAFALAALRAQPLAALIRSPSSCGRPGRSLSLIR